MPPGKRIPIRGSPRGGRPLRGGLRHGFARRAARARGSDDPPGFDRAVLPGIDRKIVEFLPPGKDDPVGRGHGANHADPVTVARRITSAFHRVIAVPRLLTTLYGSSCELWACKLQELVSPNLNLQGDTHAGTSSGSGNCWVGGVEVP
jgi:hypothetical protein